VKDRRWRGQVVISCPVSLWEGGFGQRQRANEGRCSGHHSSHLWFTVEVGRGTAVAAGGGDPKEDIKEQLTSRNLSATAIRVLQCTCPMPMQLQLLRNIFQLFTPHLT
jgi:hypothetical protein